MPWRGSSAASQTMAPAWAAGLTVTTTGLNQQDKQEVRHDVEAAGGRCGCIFIAQHHMCCHLLFMNRCNCAQMLCPVAHQSIGASPRFHVCMSTFQYTICCFAFRRYSPNLSKRTTHLVTTTVVGALSDKLAAAAAAGSRFDTHIVSIDWVAASAARRGRAAEVQYAPVLPGAEQVSHTHAANTSHTPEAVARSSNNRRRTCT